MSRLVLLGGGSRRVKEEKKNTAPFRYARVLPRLEKHRYEIRILVFVRVLLDELRCSIRRTRENFIVDDDDDAKETLFLPLERISIVSFHPFVNN